MKIGFLDSGLGGLTILRAVTAQLPQYDYVYYGDTKHLPYGNRSEEEIYDLTKAGVESLFADECLLVIIACNTASAHTLRRLQDTFLREEYPERRVLGVIVPTVETVLESGVISPLLIATQLTIQSKKYEIELAKQGNVTQLVPVATPELVGYIEAGNMSDAYTFASKIISQAVDERGIDSCILGCTHYTTLTGQLRQQFPVLQFFSQDEIVPDKLTQYLIAHPEVQHRLTQNKTRTIRLTDNSRVYDDLVVELLK